VTESDLPNGFVEGHGFAGCGETQSSSANGKGTSLLVPLRHRKSAHALAPEVCFFGPDLYFRRLFSRPAKVRKDSGFRTGQTNSAGVNRLRKNSIASWVLGRARLQSCRNCCRIIVGLSRGGFLRAVDWVFLQPVKSRGVLLVTLGVALLLDASCKRHPGTERSFFPASNQVAGWEKTGEIRTFEAADLWRYVDGDAERYLKAGVQRVSTADYKFQNKVDAVVDIYIMGNADGAEKIFNSEPVVDGKPIQLGDGARLHSQSLVFRKGTYLVRIVAYEESAETQQALLQLGQGIEPRLAR
jgi:hypothetical protein